MKIQVLGSGCNTCKKLYEMTKGISKELGLATEVEYITDMQEILNMGLMSSPVLAVDGKPILVGFVPDAEKIRKAIQKVVKK